jgi:tetratricopeptide (TPR) repeat protein
MLTKKMKLEWIGKYLKEAEQLMYTNEVDRGLELLNNLLYDEPGYGSLHNHLGWAYMYYTGEPAKAELHLRMAIKFHPEFQAPYLHIGQLLIRLGRHSEALEYLAQGVTKPEANMVAFWESTGRAYELKSEYRNAIVAYKRAMMASLVEHEMNNLNEGIKRCRKKRWVALFN